MNNKRVWKVVSFIGIAILAVIMIGSIYTVNVRYPQRVEEEITQGDFFELKKGVEMCIVDSRWLSFGLTCFSIGYAIGRNDNHKTQK